MGAYWRPGAGVLLAGKGEERNVFSLLMNSDPLYDDLRADERFKHLLQRVGFAL